MIKNINLGVIGIDHGHIFDMLDEMLKKDVLVIIFGLRAHH